MGKQPALYDLLAKPGATVWLTEPDRFHGAAVKPGLAHTPAATAMPQTANQDSLASDIYQASIPIANTSTAASPSPSRSTTSTPRHSGTARAHPRGGRPASITDHSRQVQRFRQHRRSTSTSDAL
ncbi:MAG: hypothetical protein ACRET5_18175 [Steroidobacteraceae bacterium]